MSSRAAIQTVHLLTGEKTLVLDPKQVPDDTTLLTVVHWGEVLPKGVKPTADHIHRVKPIFRSDKNAPKVVYRMTRNEAGKFKHYWDVEKDGPRPPGKPRKKKADASASEIGLPTLPSPSEKKKKTKKRDSPPSSGDDGQDAVNVARAELEAALKKLNAATSGSSQKKQKK